MMEDVWPGRNGVAWSKLMNLMTASCIEVLEKSLDPMCFCFFDTFGVNHPNHPLAFDVF